MYKYIEFMFSQRKGGERTVPDEFPEPGIFKRLMHISCKGILHLKVCTSAWLYNIKLKYLTINKQSFILFTFLLIFISMNISLTLQRDLKQSLTVLVLLFIKHYYEWARSLFIFVAIWKILNVSKITLDRLHKNFEK